MHGDDDDDNDDGGGHDDEDDDGGDDDEDSDDDDDDDDDDEYDDDDDDDEGRNKISTQNLTPCMSEIRHFSVTFSTHTHLFAVGGITSDLSHPTNVGRRSDTPWCRLFKHFLFQSVNQNLHKPLEI